MYDFIKSAELHFVLLVIVGLLLLLLSIQDVWQLQVSVKLMWVLVLLALTVDIVCNVTSERKLWTQILLLLPGSILILLDVLNMRLMGLADSIVVFCLGMMLRGGQFVIAMSCALIAVFMWAAVVFICMGFGAKKGKKKIAMIPFLTFGAIIGMLV